MISCQALAESLLQIAVLFLFITSKLFIDALLDHSFLASQSITTLMLLAFAVVWLLCHRLGFIRESINCAGDILTLLESEREARRLR